MDLTDCSTMSDTEEVSVEADMAMRVWLCRAAVIDDVRAHDILPYLRQYGTLSLEDEEEIMHEVTTRGSSARLVHRLITRGDKACQCLVTALLQTYPDLGDLVNEVSATEQDVDDYHCWLAARNLPVSSINDSMQGTCIYDHFITQIVCNAMRCNAMQCNSMQCNAMQCNAKQCHAMPCHAMPCHAMPCHAMPCHAMPCHAMPCFAMLFYLILS